MLKEKISKYQIAALIFSFLGLLFIIKPGFAEFNLFYVISLGSALFTAIAHISIKILRNTESTETVVLAFCIISSAASFFLMLAEGFVMPNINQWFHLVLLGCFATVYQSCISIAYKFAPAGELSIYGYSTLIFSSMFGIVLWNESFFISTAVGMGCIFIGGITIFYHDNVE